MTNDKAIKHLEVIKGECALMGDVIAIDMAISALSENKGDLISRQAVLDELEKWDWQELYLPYHFKLILDNVGRGDKADLNESADIEKIRAEIQSRINNYDDRNISEYEDCLAIIDKYIKGGTS